MFDVLEKQRQHQRQVDRVLKIVLPIVAFLTGCDLCQYEYLVTRSSPLSFYGLPFIAVGIKRTASLALAESSIALYCLIDNILSLWQL